METPLRWGILGTAGIARKNWKAILNSGNNRLVAVASRDARRSRRFIEECQACAPWPVAPRAVGGYEELLAAPDIDAVYIPLPTALRAPWVERAAVSGKHVLCEKPCASTLAELAGMLRTCRLHGVQFMDGVMFMHSRRLQRMRQVLDDGRTVGEIRRIASAFSFQGGDAFLASNIRARADLEPHGCLGDLGWYCIRFSLWARACQLPDQVTARNIVLFRHPDAPAAVPIEFSAELAWPDGVTAGFYCSFRTENEQWAVVSGARGQLRVADFVLPFAGPRLGFETDAPTFGASGCDVEMRPHRRRWSVRESSHGDPAAQESAMFRAFADQVRSGTLNPLWPELALKTQAVLEACRDSAFSGGRPTQVAETNH